MVRYLPRVSVDRQSLDLAWGGPERDWYYWTFWFWERPQEPIVCPTTGTVTWMRRFAFERFWYDGPHAQLKLYVFTIGWSTQWTMPPFEFLNDEYKVKWAARPKWVRRLFCMEAYEAPAKRA